MERTYRNLQKISGSFYVSLPKKWIDNFSLESKSSIMIDIRSDGSLIISPRHEKKEEQSIDEVILHSSPYVAREIVKKCLSGETNLIVLSEKPFTDNLREEIRWFVNGLPNTEITEEQSQRIVRIPQVYRVSSGCVQCT